MKSRTRKTIQWILIILLTIQFAAAGMGKFTGAWNTKFIEWGYTITFMYLIGVVEFGSIIILYIARWRKWSLFVLTLTMLGAIATHLINGEYSRIVHNGIVMILLLTVYYLDQRTA
jgi:uncharacterized membrane protein YphA (DoxX/SURF4 family)